MELFGLDPKNKGRNISSVILKILDLQNGKKRILLTEGKSIQVFIGGKLNTAISDKIQSMLKTPISLPEIISLLIILKSENGKGMMGKYPLYVNFKDNTLELNEEPINSEDNTNTGNGEKKEIKLKTTDDIDYGVFDNWKLKEIDNPRNKGEKVFDMMDMLKQSVLFCSANSIGDIGLLQEKRVYFIKGEELTFDKNFKSTTERIQHRTFARKDMQFFLHEMLELAAFNSYGPEEQLSEADKQDKQEFIDDFLKKLRKVGSIDFAVKVEGRKLRVNISNSNGKKLSAVMRVIEAGSPPPMEKLGLVGGKNGTAYKDVLGAMFGLILICGPTGSGKSMSLTAMIGEINKTQRKHIISLEDPIEFEHEDVLSIVEQKEVGVDIATYSDGLKAILRQKPQIAILGEIRDGEVMEKAIELASTGHVVFATFHSNDVPATISRILGFFPGKEEEKAQELSEFILGIFVQKLVSRKGGGKILIKEIMIQTDNTKEAIKVNDMMLLNGYIDAGGKYGMITNDKSITSLYEDDLISAKTAMNFAKDKVYMKKLTKYDEYENMK